MSTPEQQMDKGGVPHDPHGSPGGPPAVWFTDRTYFSWGGRALPNCFGPVNVAVQVGDYILCTDDDQIQRLGIVQSIDEHQIATVALQ